MLKDGNNIRQRMKKDVKAFMQHVNMTPDVSRLIVQRHTGSGVQEAEQWDGR